MQPKHARSLDEELLSVGAVADAFGVHPDTIKRWEKAGLIAAATRTPTGHRRFRRADVNARLEQLRSAS